MSPVRRIALTAGEPAGIGPDLCLQLAQRRQQSQIIVIADPALLQQRARQLQLGVELLEVDLAQPPIIAEAGTLFYLPVAMRAPCRPGELDANNAPYVVETLQRALDGCLDQRFDAVVTAPVHKGIINDAGMAFSGHTEFFADGAGVGKVVMMLATDELRVALATTHLPLRDVSDAITRSSLQQVIEIIDRALKSQFGISQPRIAVCGLNPHAGEGGHLGTEEIEVISPVIEQLRASGIELSGPWPADTIFNRDRLQDYDVVLAMYHDQGLPVLKHAGFGKAVNITLGLPFIRTSVDHGTAIELAGSGRASDSSLQAAVQMAERMAASRD